MSEVSFRILVEPALRLRPEPLPPSAQRSLREALERRLGLLWTQPVQMLLEVHGLAPVAVSVSSTLSSAACTWVRNVRLEGGKVVGGDVDAVSLVLAGTDATADERVVAAVQGFRGSHGDPLPVPIDWLARVRAHEKPLLAHWCRTKEAATDPLLSAGAELVARLLLEREAIV